MKKIKSVKSFWIGIMSIFLLISYLQDSFAVEVEFKYKADTAFSVSVAGSFNNWNKDVNKMKKGDGNIWYAKIDLEPGKYEYKFFIDGNKWVEDPNAKQYVKDPYGGRNSVIVVEPELNKDDKPPFEYVNLTGSFNNWNQADKNYIMKYVGDKTYEIVKLFYPGKYEFKFNMDMTWNINYGIGDSGENSIKQNGDNIKFFVKDLGFYRIRLYLTSKKYNIEKTQPLNSVAYVEYSPFYYIGDTIVLDASKSIVPEGVKPNFYWQEDKKNKSKIERKDLYKSKITFEAKKTGDYKYTLIIDDGKNSIPFNISFKVINRYSLVGDLISNNSSDRKTFLNYKGQGLYEKVIYSKNSGKYVFKLVMNFKYNIMDVFHFNLKKNSYYLFTYDEGKDYFNFEKKNFARFYFNPKKDNRVKGEVKSVAVAGSFNGWNTEADLLEKQDDGTFLLFKPLDEGVYHYKFVINGNQWLYDLNAPESLRINDGYSGFNSGIFVGDDAEDFGKPVMNGINWDAVEHNLSEPKYFNVIGESLLQIKIRTIANDVDKVLLVYYATNKNISELKVKENKFGFDYFSTILSLKKGVKYISYYFVLIDKKQKFYFGDNYNGKEVVPDDKRFGFRIYVKFPTPDWAKGIIWYQIMLERFRNGDKSNDPDCTIPWRWDWFKKYRCEKWDDKRFMDKRYGFYGWEGVWSRFYGGDLQGLMEKLQYLKDLGVEGIYLNPIFESPSHHKYDTADYRHIDDNFGYKGDNKNLNETLSPSTWKWTKTDKLFLQFLNEAHKMGMKVIIDGVFNHCGDNFWAFNDVKKRKNLSQYKDWFIISSWSPFKYEGWAGFGGLPVYREDENGLVGGIREHIFDITKRWMDPNGDGDPSDGIDGWRLDVPNEVNQNFWKDWRKVVKGVNPDAYITGEIWEKATPWLKGDQFDAVMNYEFAKLVYRFFINTSKEYSISPSEFDKEIKDLLSSYPMQVNFVMQNLLDSHDTDRILSGIKNPNRYFDAENRVQDNGPDYDNSKYGEQVVRIYKLIQIFQFTFVGSPMIYYGDEEGMWGADDPNNRKPMWWRDLMPYDNPENKISDEILSHTKLLARIRNSHSALKNGIFDTLVIDDKNQIYGFIRSNDNETLYIVLNRGKSSQKVTIKVESAKKNVEDLLTGRTYKVKDGKVTLDIPAISGVILK